MIALDSPEVQSLISAVRDVAAQDVVPRFRELSAEEIGSKSAADDLVTVADRAAEVALTTAILRIFPGAAIVGEEAVSEDRSVLERIDAGGMVVVIDPIDGTWNYANGLALYGMILAVIIDGVTILGLLYDPIGDDWVIAAKGQGAWFSRFGGAPRRLAASGAGTDLGARYGYIGLPMFSKPDQVRIASTLPRFHRSQSLRCSCHEYRMIVQGRVDFVLNGMLNVWDHAAGVLALQEAGGVARLLDGRAYHPSLREGHLLTAGSAALWTALAELWSDIGS